MNPDLVNLAFLGLSAFEWYVVGGLVLVVAIVAFSILYTS